MKAIRFFSPVGTTIVLIAQMLNDEWGLLREGKIALQLEGSEVMHRKIKIKEMPSE